MEHMLLFTEDQRNFYWVPTDAELPEGPVRLRTPTGHTYQVDPAHMESFRMDAARGRELAYELAADLGRHASRLVGGAASLLRSTGLFGTSATAKAAAALGLRAEELDDSERVAVAIQTLFASGRDALVTSVTDDPHDEAAWARLRELALALEGGGQEVGRTMDALPQTLRAWADDPAVASSIDEMARVVQAALGQLVVSEE